MKKIVLVYSGGLDTSVCIPLMKEEYGYDHVITVTVDVGQPAEDIKLAEERAVRLGLIGDTHGYVPALESAIAGCRPVSTTQGVASVPPSRRPCSRP